MFITPHNNDYFSLTNGNQLKSGQTNKYSAIFEYQSCNIVIVVVVEFHFQSKANLIACYRFIHVARRLFRHFLLPNGLISFLANSRQIVAIFIAI